MGRENLIIRLLQVLQDEGIRVTNDFEEDLKKLVLTDIKDFSRNILKDFSRGDFENYNRFKILKLNKKQKEIMKDNKLWRYEYRNTSNLRCIFIISNVNNIDIPVLICAFNEDGDKTKGKNSYKHNINRAIEIIQFNKEEII